VARAGDAGFCLQDYVCPAYGMPQPQRPSCYRYPMSTIAFFILPQLRMSEGNIRRLFTPNAYFLRPRGSSCWNRMRLRIGASGTAQNVLSLVIA
jgi:hypothetical protein